MKPGLLTPLLTLGLLLGGFALGPALAYEYGWIVTRSGPRASDALVAPASRSATVGIWMSIASASGVRTGAGAGPWLNLIVNSQRQPTPSPSAPLKNDGSNRPPLPPAASPDGSAAGDGAKAAPQSRP